MKTIELSRPSYVISARMALTLLTVVLLGGATQAQTQWTTGTNSNDITNTNMGKVGVGTAAPSAKLDVQIANSIGDGIKVTDAGAGGKYLYIGDGSGNSGVFAPYIAGVGSGPWGLLLEGGVPSDAANIPAVSVRGNVGYATLANSPIFTVATTSGSELFRVGATGNVGIGTTAPASLFHMYSTANNSHNLVIDAKGTGSAQEAAIQILTKGDGASALGNTGVKGWLLTGRGDALTADTTLQNDMELYFFNGGTPTFVQHWDNNGNVGIGTSNPLYSLDVNGGVNSFRAKASTTSSSDTIATFENASGIQAIVRANGNVGFGTVNPSTKLHVYGSGSQGVRLESTTAATQLDFLSNATNGGKWSMGTGWSTPGIGALWFYDNTAAATRMVIDSSGKVGIGTTNPTKALDVNGDINVSGTINAKYQDMAEWVPAAHSLPAGTVVVLNPSQSNQVMAAAKEYDTRVAGVVSARPGLTLGEAGADKVLVATTGRVKVKVDATPASIRIGDLLVTSDQEGVAMKSVPLKIGDAELHRPGTLIGKALEPLEKGTGEILVLLSLQ